MVGLGFRNARDVSADGSVGVGWAESVSGVEAFRWTATGGIVGLGALPGDNFASRAYDVSPDGSVVVGYSEPFAYRKAIRWTEGTDLSL